MEDLDGARLQGKTSDDKAPPANVTTGDRRDGSLHPPQLLVSVELSQPLTTSATLPTKCSKKNQDNEWLERVVTNEVQRATRRGFLSRRNTIHWIKSFESCVLEAHVKNGRFCFNNEDRDQMTARTLSIRYVIGPQL